MNDLQTLLAENLLGLSAEELLKKAKRFAKHPGNAALGRPLRVALLAGFLTDYLTDPLLLMLAQRGFAATLWRAPYGVMAAAILETDGGLAQFAPDLVMLLPTHRDLSRLPPLGSAVSDADRAAEAEANVWRELWKRLGVPVVQLSFDPPPTRPLGELEGCVPGGLLDHVRRVNRALIAHRPASVKLVDAEWLAARIGLEVWHDARMYALCKQPFAFAALPMVVDALAAAVAGVLQRGRKCLVLDLDNTLWGGVVGDVGLEGIVLGNETAEGEAFVAFQQYVKRLSGRGVVLAVCSKNTDASARAPFESHGGMVLKLEDIACFIANFEDKAGNIRAIARELNLGLDAMVFCDDNPVERAWVHSQLPEVLVVDLPDDPSGFARALDSCNAFPIAHLTPEDLGRAGSYRARAQIAERAASSADDMETFLASLAAQAVREPVGPSSMERIVQIIGKTNQFKLNPSVCSAEEISRRADDVLALRFSDTLQEYGIVAVAVTRRDQNTLMIDNWVMSCRVFSRRLEFLTYALLVRMAEARGCSELALQYVPSPKNGLIAELLPRLGFVETDGLWRAPVSLPEELPDSHIELIEP